MRETTVQVLVVDDHEVVRAGLREILDAADDLRVCGEAATAADAVAQVMALRPDVVVLDVRLPDGDGVSVCRELRRTAPETACLMLTSYPGDDVLVASVMAGAAGFLLKQVRGLDLVHAVRTVAAGGSVLGPDGAQLVLERLREPGGGVSGRTDVLSERERRVFDLIGEGLSNREIADAMALAEKTVKNHVSSVLRKLDLQRRTQVAVLAERTRRGAPGREQALVG